MIIRSLFTASNPSTIIRTSIFFRNHTYPKKNSLTQVMFEFPQFNHYAAGGSFGQYKIVRKNLKND